MRSKLIIPSSGIVELYDDAISLTYQMADIKDPQKRHADYSKTITVPGTANNNKMFQHIFDVGIERLFNPNKKAKAILVIDSSTVMRGYMRLREVNKVDQKIEYSIELTGRLADLFTAIGDAKIKDIDWDDMDHVYNRANQIASWSTPIGADYVYPFIDYGFSLNTVDYDVNHFFPAIYLKEYWDRIFAYAGFQYTSTSNFFNSTFFKSLVIPFNSDKLQLTSTQINNRIFRASRATSSQGISAGTTVTTSYAYNNVVFNNDTTSPNQDTGGTYNTSTGIWTCNASGWYNFSSSLDIRVNGETSSGSQAMNIMITIWARIRDITNTIPQVDVTSNFTPNIAVSGTSSSILYSQNFNFNMATPTPVFVTSGTQVRVQIAHIVQIISNTANVTYTIEVKPGSLFFNKVDGTIKDGDTCIMNNAVPQDLKMKDVINSVIKLFNLYVEYDKDTENKLIIDPRPDYYTTTIQDWTQKRDLSKDLQIIPMGALNARRYMFTYKPDGDYLNDDYQRTIGETYGQMRYDVDNDFLTNTEKEELVFSPTPLDSTPASAILSSVTSFDDRYFSRIHGVDSKTGGATPKQSNIRLLYFGGVKQCKPWNYTSTIATPKSSGCTNYPYAGHLDDPITPTVDLNYGVPRAVYYDPAFNATYTDNNMFNQYWKDEMDEITDKNSSLVVGWFRLTPKDISLVDFRHIYRFDFQNYRLNKIYDYNPLVDGLTKCEFIKIKNGVPFASNSGIINGGSVTLSGSVVVPSPKPKPKKANNSVSPATIVAPNVVLGNNNTVSSSAQRVFVSGDNNSVGDNARNVNIINSSGCVVPGDMGEVIIMNSSGITATESNQVWINNQPITAPRGRVKITSDNYEVEDGIDTVICLDQVNITLPNASFEKHRGRRITVMKAYSDGDGDLIAITRSAGQTVNNQSSWGINIDYLSETYQSDGSKWYVVSMAHTIKSNVYTPTITSVANVDSTTAYSCMYQQNGSLVTVCGWVDIDPTLASTITTIGISLPVSSDLTSTLDCIGVSTPYLLATGSAVIYADTTNNRATLEFTSVHNNNNGYSFTFQYKVQ